MVHIILVGTACDELGKALAQITGRPLYILNALIERGETVPIDTLIQDEGMDAYHEIESVYLESLLARESGVIVLSPQTLENPRNQALCQGHCILPIASSNC